MSNNNSLQATKYPLFSIIVPVYQNQETLNECIDSVLCQPGQNYEIILVDDGSTDGSGEICDEYADHYSQIISVIHKSNEGPLRARLEGIRKSQGKYLLFLDADDSYVPGIFYKLENIIENHKLDVIIFNHYRCYINGKSELNKPLYSSCQVFEGQEKQKLYEELITGNQLNTLWQKCIQREVLGDLDVFYRFGEMVIGEDKVISMEVIDRAEKIVYMTDGLYNYHIVQSSVSHSLSLKHYKDMDTVYHRTLEYMKHWEMNEYRGYCFRRKVESGLSCLYSTVRKVREGKKTFDDFKSLAIYISADKAYWKAVDLCKKSLPFPRRMICILIKHSRINTAFGFMCTDNLIKSIFRKDMK